MPVYMEYEGIKGTVTAKGFEKWIELDSVQFGVHRSITSEAGKGANRDASPAAPNEISVTKLQDDSSTALFMEAASGSGGKKVDIVIFSAAEQGGKGGEMMRWKLTNVLLSHYALSGHGGAGTDRPHESLSLNYNKIEVKFQTQDAKGTKGTTPYSTQFDLATLEK